MINNKNLAIVLDANLLHQLTAIQALGKSDIPIVAISDKKNAIGFASKYPYKKIISPMACYDDSFIKYIIANVDRGILFCGYDSTAEIVSKYKSDLKAAGFDVRISNYSTHLGLYDKYKLSLNSNNAGIRYPTSILIENKSDLNRIREKLSYPFILKPTKGDSGLYYFVRDDSNDIENIYSKLRDTLGSNSYPHSNSKIIAQEFVTLGNQELWNYNALYSKGTAIAEFTGLRIRSSVKPDGSLGSTLLYGLSKINEELNELNQNLLGCMKFDGIVETEWAFDPKNKEYVLFDVNARPSGNIRWSITGGVNLIFLYYLLCQGQISDRTVRQRNGVAYHKIFWYESDFLYSLRSKIYKAKNSGNILNNSLNTFLKNHSRVMDLPDYSDVKSAVADIKIFNVFRENLQALFAPRSHAIDVLDFSDMKPTIKIILRILHKLFGRLIKLRLN